MSWLKVKTVQVVQQVDVEELEKTIKWLVETVQAQPSGVGGAAAAAAAAAVGPLQEEIDALRRENRDLKSLMQQLQAKQNDIEERLDTKPQSDQAAKVDDGATAAAAASDPATANDAAAARSPPSSPDLERRLAALEEQLAAQQAASASQPPRDVSTPLPTATREATEGGAPAAAALGVDLGPQLQELIVGHSALAATVAGLQQELEAKPSRGELDLKANRSELDAMLRAGAPVAADGAAAAPALAVADDGSVDSGALADAVNKAGAELAALRGQVAVLAERLGGKAEQGSVDDLAGQLAALKARYTSGAAAAPAADKPGAASSATPAVDSAALDGLIRRIEEVEVKLAAAGTAAPAGATGEEDTAAVEAIDTLADVQPLLKDIYARLDAKADRSGVEDALRQLQELASALAGKADTSAVDQVAARVAAAQRAAGTAAAAAARRPSSGAAAGSAAASRAASRPSSAQQQQEQPFVISHELPTADLEAAINDLRSQLAALKAQVVALGSAASNRAAAAPSGAAAAIADANAKRLSAVTGDGADSAALGAVERLQAQLGELLTRVASKADASELARLELLVNGKADVDEVAELRGALGAKADGAALDELQLAVAGKAEQSALDEVKLMATLTAGAAAEAGDGTVAEVGGEGGGSGGGGGGYTNLLGAIQGMVGDKATKAELLVLQGQLAGKATAEEVAALREALEGKAGAAELAVLAGQVLGHAGQEALASLDQRMGDVYAELDKIRADLAALPAEVLAGGAGAGRGASGPEGVSGDAAAGLQRMVSQLSREVGSLREGLDTVSHAANVLAVGLDNARADRSYSGMGMGAVDGQYGDAGGAGGKENRSPRGGYERLVKLLGSGEFRHKMDFFDPAALQQMAQKLASLEATLKSPAMARMGAGGNVNGTDHGLKDLERQLKRLAIDVRVMKDKMIDPSTTGPRMAPGDHAMLAARPIQGYRCMACDRPLDTLDTLPGPHIPTAQLPVRGSPVDPAGRIQARSGRQGADQLSPQPSADKLKPNHDPNVRGVQNWYTDTKGLAAEALPREHVGPHLPPGGWRPSNPGTLAKLPAAQSNLPNISAPKSSRSPVPDISGYSTPPQQPSPVEGAANVSLPQLS